MYFMFSQNPINDIKKKYIKDKKKYYSICWLSIHILYFDFIFSISLVENQK